MKKFLLTICIITLSVLVFCETRVILFNDFSTYPIDPKANPDFKRKGEVSRPGVYLISYADGAEIFFMNQNALAASVINRGVDFIFNYRRSHLDPEFVKKHTHRYRQVVDVMKIC